jgi:hypothetical protein
MARRKLRRRPSSDVLTRLSELLDNALEQTFARQRENKQRHRRVPLENADQPTASGRFF